MHKDAYAGAPSKFSSTAARIPISESPENKPEKPRYPFLSYFSILLSSRPKPLSQAAAPPKDYFVSLAFETTLISAENIIAGSVASAADCAVKSVRQSLHHRSEACTEIGVRAIEHFL
ncbi:hypothetical protein AVEN_74128-1 [Araneus ventricosus]|uniref:Uncharacterized protein n=1 Tax=Araneus ventricosus TaxID=182803 RepID=A0A4Y2P229_ARAVE|nr:hypothetical protein AVEN_74128-1 [Araneus ventricosus]